MQALDTAERERAIAPAEPPVALPETAFTLTPPHSAASMHVTKRDGGQEAVNVNKIVRALTRSAEGLDVVDPVGVAVKTSIGDTRIMGSPGAINWPGASGTDWWVDPKEDLVVVYMSAAPGPLRWHYRQVINALVYQALTE